MGKDAKIRHMRKFFDGAKTPEQVHRETVLAGIKCHCGCPAAGKAMAFAPVKDLMEKDPGFLIGMSVRHKGQVPMVKFKYGDFVRMGTTYYCDLCKSACEKAMAKLPSWILVEWDGGPPKMNPQVQVAGEV